MKFAGKDVKIEFDGETIIDTQEDLRLKFQKWWESEGYLICDMEMAWKIWLPTYRSAINDVLDVLNDSIANIVRLR